jgi:hypothetical protein
MSYDLIMLFDAGAVREQWREGSIVLSSPTNRVSVTMKVHLKLGGVTHQVPVPMAVRPLSVLIPSILTWCVARQQDYDDWSRCK